MNFKDFVDKIDDIYREIKKLRVLTGNPSYTPEKYKVAIPTRPKAGYFGTFETEVEDIKMGIDWDDGTIFIIPKRMLDEVNNK